MLIAIGIAIYPILHIRIIVRVMLSITDITVIFKGIDGALIAKKYGLSIPDRHTKGKLRDSNTSVFDVLMVEILLNSPRSNRNWTISLFRRINITAAAMLVATTNLKAIFWLFNASSFFFSLIFLLNVGIRTIAIEVPVSITGNIKTRSAKYI